MCRRIHREAELSKRWTVPVINLSPLFFFLFFFWPGFVILGLDPVNMSPLPDGLMLGSVIR